MPMKLFSSTGGAAFKWNIKFRDGEVNVSLVFEINSKGLPKSAMQRGLFIEFKTIDMRKFLLVTLSIIQPKPLHQGIIKAMHGLMVIQVGQAGRNLAPKYCPNFF